MNQGEIIIDNYKILTNSIIGKGQYGCVYNCQMIKNFGQNIEICAKIMQVHDDTLKKYSEGEKKISEIISENQNNENLVKIFLVREIPDQKKLLIIMEKCESNLQKLWEQKQKFNDQEILDFLIQFLNGYKVLYNKNIIHRDIKPENILIRYQNGKIIYKLADFGIGKIYKANDFIFTKIGTPAYAAPEINSSVHDAELNNCFLQMKNIEHSRSQVDMFSLGIILYQLHFGNFPFDKTTQSILQFLNGLKQNTIKLQGNSQYIAYIEKMLTYYPHNRMAFSFLIQEVDKIVSGNAQILRQTINNNVDFKLQQIPKVAQNKGQKPFQPINQNNNQQAQMPQQYFQPQQAKPNFQNQQQNQFQNGQINNNQQQNQFQNGYINNNQQQNQFQNGFINNNQQQNQFQNGQVNNNQQQNQKILTNNNQQYQNCQSNQNGNQPLQQFILRQSLTSMNPYQKIKEYLEYLLINQGEILKIEAIMLFQSLIDNYNNNNQAVANDQLKDLMKIYPIKENNIQKYDSRTLTYFYCLSSALLSKQNIQIVDDNKMREEITKFYYNFKN